MFPVLQHPEVPPSPLSKGSFPPAPSPDRRDSHAPAQGTLGPDLPRLTEGHFQTLKRGEGHRRDLNTGPFANLHPGANAHNWSILQSAAAGSELWSLNPALARACQRVSHSKPGNPRIPHPCPSTLECYEAMS